MDRNTIVQIYSMTKPITGTALMTLYEEGKFDLDDPVAKYAPEFTDIKVYTGEDAYGKPILESPFPAIFSQYVLTNTNVLMPLIIRN